LSGHQEAPSMVSVTVLSNLIEVRRMQTVLK
jgi:hypothetical protein